MRIALLAGAVAMTAPMVADAATYRLQYSGSSTYQGTFDPSARENPFPQYTPSLQRTFYIDAPDGEAFSFSVGYPHWYGDDGKSYGPVDRVSVQAGSEVVPFITYYTNGNYRFAAQAPLSASISADGLLISASLTEYEQYDYIARAEQGSYVYEDRMSNNLYTGPGYWRLTEVAPVPLPATAPLLLAGLAAMGWYRRRD